MDGEITDNVFVTLESGFDTFKEFRGGNFAFKRGIFSISNFLGIRC